MKLCWMLGVLTIALCEGNNEIKKNDLFSPKSTSDGNRTVVQPQLPPTGDDKNISKRQAEDNPINKVTSPDDRENDINADPNRPQVDSNSLSLMLEKRKFSSWGGKRGPEDSNEYKRTRFSSWAGKRNYEADDISDYNKRNRFSSWGGKRSDISDLEFKRKLLERTLAGYTQDETDDSEAGTRRIHEDKFDNEEKRSKFSSWGGKRSDTGYDFKRKFSSWGGKRGFDQEQYLDLIKQLYVPYGQVPGVNTATNSRIKTDTTNQSGATIRLFDEKETGLDQKNSELSRLNGFNGYSSDSNWDLSADKRNKFSSWGGKRKFSSWGGKRSGSLFDMTSLTNGSPDEQKRTRFYSWSGKRALLPLWDSRYEGKFLSSNVDPLNDFTDEEKRGKFSSWGGKRSADIYDTYEDKRTRFSSWAGKRFDNENDGYFNADKRDSNYVGLKKKLKGRGFSSWGGKRSYPDGQIYSDDPFNRDSDSYETKRAPKFSSWGGKRSQDIDEEKRKFSSWGGKRSQDIEEEKRKFSSWGGKRSQDIIEDEKRKFSSWGGKRNYYQLVEGPKRPKFSSWAGKRSVNPDDGPETEKEVKSAVNQVNNTVQTKLEDVNFNQSEDSLNTNKFKRGFSNYYRQFEMIKRNPLLRAWIGRNYPEVGQMTWKRRPAFSSWGGKRSLDLGTMSDMPQDEDAFDEEKRVRFSNWGGKKRSVEKRSAETTTKQILEKLIPNKKTPRTSKILGTRTALESHFYLRSSKNGLLTPAIRPIRRQFYAWGGKRAHNS